MGIPSGIFGGFSALLIAYLGGCVTVSTMDLDKHFDASLDIIEEGPKDGAVKAVVVLLHGLNLKPTRMDDWAIELSRNGCHVVRFALYGHDGEEEHMRRVAKEIWQEQFKDALDLAHNRARKFDAPLFFVGFSLGALIGLEWLSSLPKGSDEGFEKMALIAPAISVPWYSRASINAMSIFGEGMMLPSRSPKSYRANKGTSIRAYRALFQLKDSLESKGYQNANVDTLVLIDKNDELIDSRSIRLKIQQYRLSKWRLHTVDNRFAHKNYGFRHLMVDEESMGKELWSSLLNLVLEHFSLIKRA